MRLRLLDLIRYGKFTGQRIDLGPKPLDAPDFHILYGLNEAGKSTVANAYLDLLYGIEERSRYAFLHDYAAMRVDGVLELDGRESGFSRTKQRRNSLLDQAGQPVLEASIAAHLAGLSRGDYASMFYLNDETLEEGGQAILDSRGDLGQLLFAAGAGLAHASDALSALNAEAEHIYRKHAQSTELVTLKKHLVELKAAREAIDTLASTHEALDAERADANRRYEEIVNERATLAARLEVIGSKFRAIPILTELERKLTALADIPGCLSSRPVWTGSVSDLIRDDATAVARIAANADELRRLKQRIGGIETDEAILAISERVHALTDLKARHVAAGLDLPARKIELQILEHTVATSLAALGRHSEPDPRLLLLPAASVGAVRGLVEERSGILIGLRFARQEASATVAALEAARDRFGDEHTVSAQLRVRLAAAVATARESDNVREKREATQVVDQWCSQLKTSLLQLHPWCGDADALAIMQVPRSGDLLIWRKTVSEKRTHAAVLKVQIVELENARRALCDRLDVVRGTAELTEDMAAKALRVLRDDAWERHRQNLAVETADAFAAVLEEDDIVGAKRLANARMLEELRGMTISLAKNEESLTTTRAELVDTEAALASIAEEIRQASGPLADHLELIGSPDRPSAIVPDGTNRFG